MAENSTQEGSTRSPFPHGENTPPLESVMQSLTTEIKKLNEQYRRQTEQRGTSGSNTSSTRRTYSYADDFERVTRNTAKTMAEFQKQLADTRKQTATEMQRIVRDLETLAKEATGSAKALEEYRLRRMGAGKQRQTQEVNEVERVFTERIREIEASLAPLGMTLSSANALLKQREQTQKDLEAAEAARIAALQAQASATTIEAEKQAVVDQKIAEAKKEAAQKQLDATASLVEQAKKAVSEQSKALEQQSKDLASVEERHRQITANLDQYSSRIAEIASSADRTIDDFVSQSARLSKKREDALGTADEQYLKRRDEAVQALESRIALINQEIRQQSVEQENLRRRYAQMPEDITAGADEQARAYQAILANIVELERKKAEAVTEEQKGLFQKEIDKQKKEAESLKAQREAERESIAQKIEDSEKIVEQSREAVEKIKEQADAIKAATPAKEELSKMGKSIGDAFKSAGSDILKGLSNWGFDRFLDSWQSGFDRVYQSIESTRNEISARLQLSQGDYSDLQSELHEMIESQGLESVMSVADINDILTGLVQTGITDTETIKALTMIQAQLKASGSSASLTNEGTLESILQLMQSGQFSMSDIQDMFLKTYAGTESYIRKRYGNEMALTGGNGDRIIKSITDMAVGYGWTPEQAQEALATTMDAAVQGQVEGLDSDIILQLATQQFEQGYNQSSALGRTLVSGGADFGKDFSKAYQQAIDTAIGIYSGIDANLAPMVSQAWDTGFTAKSARVLQQMQPGEIKVGVSDDTIQTFADGVKEGLRSGDWYSKTYTVQRERENTMTDIAIDMEQYYKGDVLYHAVTDPILGGIKNVVNAILSSSIGTSGAFSGNAFGAVSTVLGGVAGIGMAGYSLKKNLATQGWAAFEDSSFGKGVGLALGAALGGPVGAVIGSTVGGNLAEWGKEIGEWFAGGDSVADAQIAAAEKLQSAGDSLMTTSELMAVEAQKDADAYIKQKQIYENFDENQKEQYLKDNDLWTAEMTQNDSRAAIDEAFKKAIEKWSEEQERIIVAKQAEAAKGTITTDLMSSLPLEGVEEAFSDQAISEMSNKDVINAVQNADEDLINYLLGYGISQEDIDSIKETGDISFLDKTVGPGQGIKEGIIGQAIQSYRTEKYKGSQVKRAYQSESGLAALNAIEAYMNEGEDYSSAFNRYYESELESGTVTSDFVSQTAQQVEQLAQNRNLYNEDNAIFKDKWKEIEKENPNATLQDLASAYQNKYRTENILDVIRLNENGELLVGDDGLPNLRYSTEGGLLYEPSIWRGKFESGLSEVPYDNYPALLHKGERVLTKEEANAYNELSSYAVSQITTNADSIIGGMSSLVGDTTTTYSSIFNSKTFGTDDIDNSVKDQTKVMALKLDNILRAIYQLASALGISNSVSSHANVLRMNSNFTELNTV